MLEELIKAMKPYDRVEIAYKSGVSIQTINNLFSGAMKNPTIGTLEAIHNFIKEKEKENLE